MTPIVRAEALRHVYSAGTPFEKVAIDGIDLSLTAGQLVGVIGHTGSGKSTFIQHLNGLLRPTSGAVYFEEQDIHRSKEATRDVRFSVGLVFQYPEYQLFEETVFKDISFGPKNMGLEDEEVERRVRQAAAFAGIDEEMLEKSPFDLSGGQKRRVAIAGVIAMEPKVLILDEPTAGLDPRGREAILAQLRDYHRQKGNTVILVSHSMEEIARNVDRIIVMSHAHKLMDGTPEEIFSRANELLQVGLDVPQVTKVAMELQKRGLLPDSSIYTIDELVRRLLALKGGEAVC